VGRKSVELNDNMDTTIQRLNLSTSSAAWGPLHEDGMNRVFVELFVKKLLSDTTEYPYRGC